MYVYLYIYYDSAKIKSISKSPYVVMDNIDATKVTVVNFGNVPIFLVSMHAGDTIIPCHCMLVSITVKVVGSYILDGCVDVSIDMCIVNFSSSQSDSDHSQRLPQPLTSPVLPISHLQCDP